MPTLVEFNEREIILLLTALWFSADALEKENSGATLVDAQELLALRARILEAL